MAGKNAALLMCVSLTLLRHYHRRAALYRMDGYRAAGRFPDPVNDRSKTVKAILPRSAVLIARGKP